MVGFRIHTQLLTAPGRHFIKPQEAFSQIEKACQIYPWLKPQEIQRQWQRALKRAVPRYPADTYPGPVTHPERKNSKVNNKSETAPPKATKEKTSSASNILKQNIIGNALTCLALNSN